MKRTVIAILLALATSLGFSEEGLVTETETTTRIGGAPWRVYLDSGGKMALDANDDGEPDRFHTQYTADQAAKTYLHKNSRGEAFTGLAGVSVFRHTTKGRTLFIPDGPNPQPVTPPVDPELPIDLDKMPEGVTAIYVDAPGGDSEGNDSSDGLTPETAVASPASAKLIASTIDGPAWIMLRRGDTFPPLGRFTTFKGTADRYARIGAYGDGPRPTVDISGGGVPVELWKLTEHVEIVGLHIVGGTVGLHGSRGYRVVDCEMVNTNLIAQPLQAGEDNRWRCVGVEVIDTTIRDVVAGDSHRQGIFLNNVDGGDLRNVIMLNCGFKSGAPDTPVVFNQGLYATGTCGPVNATGCWFIANAGDGAQFRSAGDVRDCVFAWNMRTAVAWGRTYQSPTSNTPGSGEFTNNYAHGAAGVVTMTLGNLSSGRIHHNTIAGPDLAIIADHTHGPNIRGGKRFGINNLTIDENAIANGKNATVLAEWTKSEIPGWGIMPDSFGVKFINNRTQGGAPTFNSPLNVARDNTNKLIDVRLPPLTDELRAAILSRELTAEQFIEQHKAHQ